MFDWIGRTAGHKWWITANSVISSHHPQPIRIEDNSINFRRENLSDWTEIYWLAFAVHTAHLRLPFRSVHDFRVKIGWFNAEKIFEEIENDIFVNCCCRCHWINSDNCTWFESKVPLYDVLTPSDCIPRYIFFSRHWTELNLNSKIKSTNPFLIKKRYKTHRTELNCDFRNKMKKSENRVLGYEKWPKDICLFIRRTIQTPVNYRRIDVVHSSTNWMHF